MKILVIDDSRSMRKILRSPLVELGHCVSEASNGVEGLEAIESGDPFDVVLVDWNMPVMNGLEFVTQMRANPSTDSVKVMMVTTEVEMGKISQALKAGANEYLMKPFTREALQEKFQHLVQA